MKEIVEDLILGTLGVLLGSWFVPREDYEYVKTKLGVTTAQLEHATETNRILLERDNENLVAIADLKPKLAKSMTMIRYLRDFARTVREANHPNIKYRGKPLDELAAEALQATQVSNIFPGAEERQQG